MTSSSTQWQQAPQIQPARLAFLAIYNPTLGPTDETFPEQCVFWYSRASHEARVGASKTARNDRAGGDAAREEENEKLRQIGLAQGVVDFARTFSDGKAVDSIDTEKSRIVLHELESGWWILASIDLTRIPVASQSAAKDSKKSTRAETDPAFEYSSREVSPPTLLTRQILKAHQIFTLHHGPSLTELYVRLPRPRFCSLLERFWTRFSQSWDVLLHGNPAADVFDGFRLASGGELGIGVGEEQWGSGERDVLEDLTRRTEGLVDVVVSRFSEPAAVELASRDEVPWMGSGCHPSATDGVIFAGVNAVSRASLSNISAWLTQIYTYGEHAYGVRDNPSRERRKRRRRNLPEFEPDLDRPLRKAASDVSATDWTSGGETATPSPDERTTRLGDPMSSPSALEVQQHGVPRPIVTAAVERSLNRATDNADASIKREEQHSEDNGTTLGIPDNYMKYLTLGLSTLAKPSAPRRPLPRRTSTSSSKTIQPSGRSSIPSLIVQEPIAEQQSVPTLVNVDPIPDGETRQAKVAKQIYQETKGHFIIGLKGDLDEVKLSVTGESAASIMDADGDDDGDRTVLRTLHIELSARALVPGEQPDLNDESPSMEGMDAVEHSIRQANEATKSFHRMRVLIYVRRPFIYCFLFQNRTHSLQMASFYKTLHQSILPIHKSLLASTDPGNAKSRKEELLAMATLSGAVAGISDPGNGRMSATDDIPPIYDLLYDPRLLTVQTTLPNIPEPGTPAAEGFSTTAQGKKQPSSWNRIESLNVHSQILSTLASTSFVSPTRQDLERTSKTTRGWWVAWLRLPPSGDTIPDETTSKRIPALVHNSSTESDATLPGPPSTTATSQKVRDMPQMERTAFIVRKALDPSVAASAGRSGNRAAATAGSEGTASRAVSSMWNILSLKSTALSDESTGGSGAGWGPAGGVGLRDGIGFDVRRYADAVFDHEKQ